MSLRTRVILFYAALLVATMGGLNFFLTSKLKAAYIDDFREKLFAETRLLASQAADLISEPTDSGKLKSLVNSNSQTLGHRITIILPDGRVLIDTSMSPDMLENHLMRLEIQNALVNGQGSAIRFSDTLKSDMLYVAVQIRQGDQLLGFMRMSHSISKIENGISFVRKTILFGTFLATLAAILLATLVTRYTIQPLRTLTRDVLMMGSGAHLEITPLNRSDEVGSLHKAFRDMSHQITMQITQLRREQARLSAVLTHMNDGILIVDSEGKVELINPAAQEIFKISEEEAIEKSLIEVVRHHQIVELWSRAVSANEQQVTTIETSPVRMYLQAIVTPLGTALPGSTLMVFQDLTRMKHLEMVRRDFVSNVSHELRTPLASLKLLTETLMEGALEEPAEARKFLDKIDAEIDNLTQMVHELLELSRIESGRVPLHKHPITPCDLVGPAVERMEIQAARAGLTLTWACPSDLPRVSADPERMEQVMVNLLHNAIKFTPPGGKIDVSAHQEKGCVVFVVRDTGIGIPAADLERIFERFYKADPSRSGGGTGLGLSIARHLVEGHGGKIWAESQPGNGSSFFFSLPIS